MNIITKIEQSGFLAEDREVETMARERQAGVEFNGKAIGTYLKILVARTSVQCGPRPARRRKLKGEEIADQLKYFEDVAAACYIAVSKAVITPDIEVSEQVPPKEASRRALERNRRTNYARSAASTLRSYIIAGLDVRLLEPATVSKGSLRDATPRPEATAPSETRISGRAQRFAERIAEEALALAAIDKRKAEAMLSDLLERMEDTLQKIRAGEAATAPQRLPLRRVTRERRAEMH